MAPAMEHQVHAVVVDQRCGHVELAAGRYDLERIVRSKAVLLPGVKVSLNIEGPKETTSRTWTYPEGMKGYLKEMLADAEPVGEIFDGENYVTEANGYAVGEGAGWAFAVVDEAKGYGSVRDDATGIEHFFHCTRAARTSRAFAMASSRQSRRSPSTTT